MMAMEIGKYNIESNLKYSSDEGLEEVNESINFASTGKNSSKENDHGKGRGSLCPDLPQLSLG